MDQEVEKKLKALQEGAAIREKAIKKLTRATMRLTLLIIAILLGAGAFTLYAGGQIKDAVRHNSELIQKTHTLAKETAGLAIRTHNLTVTIKNQRHDAIITSCRDGNTRHDKTVKSLRKKAGQESAHPPFGLTKQLIEQNLKYTITLIDDIQPHLNCNQQLVKLTK